jgi:hypothetical protein
MTTTSTTQIKVGSKISSSGAFAEVPFSQARTAFTRRSHRQGRGARALAATGAVILGCYCLIAVFGLFVIPFKIHMRSQRRANQRTEMLEALRHQDRSS